MPDSYSMMLARLLAQMPGRRPPRPMPPTSTPPYNPEQTLPYYPEQGDGLNREQTLPYNPAQGDGNLLDPLSDPGFSANPPEFTNNYGNVAVPSDITQSIPFGGYDSSVRPDWGMWNEGGPSVVPVEGGGTYTRGGAEGVDVSIGPDWRKQVAELARRRTGRPAFSPPPPQPWYSQPR